MNVAIIIIGDELLIGQVTDTNSGMIARVLAPYGWTVTQILTVADDATAIEQAIDNSFAVAPIVLTTGGLGPTKDDITKRVLCRYFGGELRRDPSVLENVEQIFARKQLKMNALTASQADVPTSCKVIQNHVGTAPIMWFERNSGRNVLVSMPGVPSETAAMFPSAVLPQLIKHFQTDMTVEHRTMMLYGISESDLATHLAGWEEALPEHLHLAYLPKDGIIRLRLDCRTTLAAGTACTDIEHAFQQLAALTQPWLVSLTDRTPAEILLEMLYQRSLTVATAESCTGGNIAHHITLVAGSSQAMLGGIVSYSNDVKTHLLNVNESTIAAVGAVSENVVSEMAEGVCRATGASLGIATSGIAGPGGGSEEKPVGTVCIGISLCGHTVTATRHFGGNREQIIERATTAAIMMAVKALNTH